jgi:hypothetical protein
VYEVVLFYLPTLLLPERDKMYGVVLLYLATLSPRGKKKKKKKDDP